VAERILARRFTCILVPIVAGSGSSNSDGKGVLPAAGGGKSASNGLIIPNHENEMIVWREGEEKRGC